MIPELTKAIARSEAAHVERERQQGLGKPIISAELNGTRFVAVKNRLLYSKKWRTFADFLFGYIKMVLGSEWGNAEIAKPEEVRHPIAIWYQKVCAYQQEQIKEPGKVHTKLLRQLHNDRIFRQVHLREGEAEDLPALVTPRTILSRPFVVPIFANSKPIDAACVADSPPVR